ncbi:MAG: hypothetical protein M3361_17465 [Candidatus Tectomicrobia bacterium]|nr:hypothetical protein [Candidatus Tectomicrobia bacterium]
MSSWSFLAVGDLLQLPDGSKLWVKRWQKTLGRGTQPVLEVHGYRCPDGV